MSMSSMGGGIRSPPTPPLDPAAAMTAMMGKLNVRSRGNSGSVPGSPAGSMARRGSVRSLPHGGGSHGSGGGTGGSRHGAKLSTTSLRAFKLGGGERGVRVAPTF
jgi:hypothetical protein